MLKTVVLLNIFVETMKKKKKFNIFEKKMHELEMEFVILNMYSQSCLDKLFD